MDEETGAMGFDSGSMPVEADATEWPTMTLEVNSTDPIWICESPPSLSCFCDGRRLSAERFAADCKPHCELG